MSLTSGFFNSRNGDRTYFAEQFSSLFGGIITDGVFKHYPSTNEHFRCTTGRGRKITIGRGRAWLNNVWINNDSDYVVYLDPLRNIDISSNYDRVDALYFKVDKSNAGREGTIIVVKGTPDTSEDATYVRMEDTAEIFYHLIAIFRVTPSTNDITSWHYRIGADTPYIIGPLEAETVIAEMQQEIDEQVESIMQSYVADENSPIYRNLVSVPMVWLCDRDVPSSPGSNATLYRSEDHPRDNMAYLYPDFFGANAPASMRVPRVGDAVLGANGYYGVITSADVHRAQYYDQYEIEVRGTGGCLDQVFTVSFWNTGASSQCDKTYSEIKAAYDSGRLIRFRWTPGGSDTFGRECYSGTQMEVFVGSVGRFVFIYQNIAPDAVSLAGFAWTRIVCTISSTGQVTNYFDEA